MAGEGFAQDRHLDQVGAVFQGASRGEDGFRAAVGAGVGGGGLQDRARDDIGAEHGGLGEDEHPGDLVLQFLQVAGPVPVFQEFEGCGREAVGGLAVAGGEVVEEGLGKDRDVAPSGAEGWERQFGDGEGVVEVGAEFALGHHAGEVGARACDQAEVGGQRLLPAGGRKGAFDDQPPEGELQGGGGVFDAFQEQSATVGLLCEADAVDATGQNAALGPEKLDAGEVVGEACEGERVEGAVRAEGAEVHGAGQAGAAGAGFAGQERRGMSKLAKWRAASMVAFIGL